MYTSIIARLLGAVLVVSAGVAGAQPAPIHFEQPAGYQRAGEALLIQPAHGIDLPHIEMDHADPSETDPFESLQRHYPTGPYENQPTEDEAAFSCAAIGCPGSPPAAAHEHGASIGDFLEIAPTEEEAYQWELPGQIEHEAASPIHELPQDERGARAEYYRQLQRHASGEGTIEDVENAYRHLIRYR